MRKVLLAIALLGLVGSAAATDPQDNLANGALIAHCPDPTIYTPGGDYCGLYEPIAITDCASQDNQVESLDYLNPTVFFLLAQWGEYKELGAAQFGFGPFDVVFWFAASGACIPPGGQLTEFASSGWPGPNEGTAITAGVAWTGDFIPLYWFEGYGYGYTTIPTGPNPDTGLAEFANTEVPGVAYPIVFLGGMGINQAGIYVCAEAVENFVCCYEDGGCALYPDEGACVQSGGTWRPDLGQSCDPNPCPLPMYYACCFEDGSCELVMNAQTCVALGGVFYGEYDTCDPNPCPQPTVCCFGPNMGQCILLLDENDCIENYENGTWYPEDHSCDPSPCPVPANDTSWGSIKAIYR
jgi:hypothetical protein